MASSSSRASAARDAELVREPLLGSPGARKSPSINCDGEPQLPAPDRSSVVVQLHATIHRQLIQKKRMPVACCVELMLPVVFILGLVAASKASDITTEPAARFVREGQAPIDFPGLFRNATCRNGTSSEQRLNALLPPCDFARAAASSRSFVCEDPSRSRIPVDALCVDRDFSSVAIGLLGAFDAPIRLMTFDELVMLQWAWRLLFSAKSGQLFADQNVKNALMNSGFLYFTPQASEAVQQVVQRLNATHWTFKYVYAPQQYSIRSEAVAYLTSVEAEGKGWGLIDFGRIDAQTFQFEISLNRSASAVNTWQVRDQFTLGTGGRYYSIYYASGFLSLQTALTNDYMTAVQNMSQPLHNHLAAVPMPYDSYKNNAFLKIAGRLSPLVLVLSFLFGVSQLTKRLVEEKEQRLREAMLIMGLGKSAFFLSWGLIYVVQSAITSAAIAATLKIGLLTQSDPTVIFVAYFLFSCSTVTLSTLLASFFSKSRISALVAPILFFLCAIPSFALPEGTQRNILLLLSLLSPSAFAQATGLLFEYEVGLGMGWKNVNSKADSINMATAMFMMLFDTALYALLTTYFDAVFPNEWGVRRHPLFFLAPLLRCCGLDGLVGGGGDRRQGRGTGKGRFSTQGADGAGSAFAGGNNGTTAPSALLDVSSGGATQQRPGSPRAGMSAAALAMHGDAVEDYPDVDDHATVHLNFLHREFEGDAGAKVAVDNLELRLFPNQTTVICGHNGSGKTTTINMITGMLGMTDGDCIVYGKSVRQSLSRARAEIGFCPQHNILWPQLTCLEHLRYFARLKGVPAADAEEAALSMLKRVDLFPHRDQFAGNLSGGQKRKLSVAIAFIGNSRLVLLDEPSAGQDVSARRFMWDLIKEMSVGRTIVLTTHFMDEAELLGARVAILSKGALHSYGSPMFLRTRLGTGYRLRVSTDHAVADAGPLTRAIRAVVPGAELKENKGQELAFTLPMSLTKSFAEMLRQLESAEARQQYGITGISMSVSTLEDVFLRIADEEELGGTLPEVGAEDDDSGTSSKKEGSGDEVDRSAVFAALDKVFSVRPADEHATWGRQLGGLLMKRFHNGRRDRRTICLQIILPLAAICMAMLLARLGPPPQPRIVLDYGMYGGVGQALALANCSDAAGYFNPQFVLQDRGAESAFNFSEWLLGSAKETGDLERYVAAQCGDPVNTPMMNPTGPQPSQPTTLLFTNASAWHSLPQILNEYLQALTRRAHGDADISIQVASQPLPWGARAEAGIDSFRALIVGFFTLIPFTFIPSTYVSWVVKERECHAKHLQLVSGARFAVYWLSNYIFDLVSFFVTELIALVIFAAFQRDEFVGSGEALACMISLLTLYGLSSIANSYAVSFLFSNHGSAQNIVMMGNFMCGFVLVITIFILKQIESTETAAKVLVFFFRLVPSYCLGEGILAMSTAPLLRTLNQAESVFALGQTGWAQIYMAINFVAFTALTIFLDHPARQRAKQLVQMRASSAKQVAVPTCEDADVQRERTAIEERAPDRQGDVIRIERLRKVYPLSGGGEKVAVRCLSVGVKQKEVFGWLGSNGAGKSTTLSIIAGEQLPTSGAASVDGFDVVAAAGEVQRRIGYCPQFDAHCELMTPEEHLALFAALRGVPAADTPAMIDALVMACDLIPHRAVPSKKLSGGNRRKLSLALALVGAPPIVILDEASAGIDCAARRRLYDAILYVAQRSSVVVTSHHLEEIDALANRVAIMVDGEMRCIGTLEHLKRKFGAGFELTVKARAPDDVPTVERFVASQFPSAKLVESRQQKLTYALPTASTRLSAVFEIMQRARDDPQLEAIADYTVQQSSLEQVFLRIAQAQAAEQEDEAAAAASADQENEQRRQSTANGLEADAVPEDCRRSAASASALLASFAAEPDDHAAASSSRQKA